MNLQAKFETALNELRGGLIERDAEIELAMVGLVARENCLFVGPPGTAKSLVADSVSQFVGGRKFSVLFGRFSTPDEVFGPISITGLKAGTYERLTEGYLPSAHVGFVDEVFKGSSAILNNLLNIMNERTFINGSTKMKCPTLEIIGASNEWGNGDDNSALFDRFLLRKAVLPVSPSQRDRLLFDDLTIKLSVTVSPDEVATAHEEAARLPWSDSAKEVYGKIVDSCHDEKVFPGDRRLRKSVGAVAAFAWTQGSTEVLPEHLEILQHTLWTNPDEQPKIVAKIVARLANPPRMRVVGLLQESRQVLADCGTDLTTQITAKKKLEEIARKLAKIEHASSEKAIAIVKAEIRTLALKAVGA